jgi:hypothetical protein
MREVLQDLMSDPDPKKTATQTLAELVARKAAAGGGPNFGGQGRKQTERAAAARAASKSKPALRKS